MTAKQTKIDEKTYREPTRSFEISGHVNPRLSYHVSLENVTNTARQNIQTMIDRGRYFSIFAPRQSGKTTFFKRICRELEKDPAYAAVRLSFQKYSKLDAARFYAEVEEKLYDQLLNRLEQVKCEKIEMVRQLLTRHHLVDHISWSRLFEKLNRLIRFKKIVIFIDEFDGIPLSELENFLTSLRDLYQDYKDVKEKALYSIGLIGIRNITKLIVGGVSPFNIADQVNLPPFSLKNVRELYRQYTDETNQPFSEEAVKKVYVETAGQPWLVNRLGSILTLDIKPGTIEPIDEKDVLQAILILLREKNDHFDNLYEKAKLFKETFVEIVFDHVEYDPDDEDQGWLEQYGLIKDNNGNAVVANNIYKARYLKTFFKEIKAYREISLQAYTLAGNRLDLERILLDFNLYIAQIGVSAFYQKKKTYEKTGQFLLTAWLYPFVKNGDGEVRYEVISGLGRMDILISYKGRKYIIETKVNRGDDINEVLDAGITQVCEKYLATEAVLEGYLVIFDTRTRVGSPCKKQVHQDGKYKITSFNIAIGRPG